MNKFKAKSQSELSLVANVSLCKFICCSQLIRIYIFISKLMNLWMKFRSEHGDIFVPHSVNQWTELEYEWKSLWNCQENIQNVQCYTKSGLINYHSVAFAIDNGEGVWPIAIFSLWTEVQTISNSFTKCHIAILTVDENCRVWSLKRLSDSWAFWFGRIKAPFLN